MSQHRAVFTGPLAPVAHEALKRDWYVTRNGRGQLSLSSVGANLYCWTSPMTGVPSNKALGLDLLETSFVTYLSAPCIRRVELSHELLVAIAELPFPLPTCAVRLHPIPSVKGEPPAVRIALEHRIHGVGFRPLEAIGVAEDMAHSSSKGPLTKMVMREFGGELDPAIPNRSFDTVLTLNPDEEVREPLEASNRNTR